MNKQAVIAFICTFCVLTPGLAEITTDGSVGKAMQLSGPQFRIGQNLGTLRGNNLFHSFSRFNLNSAESATFTGNSQIQNVISRVTGGTRSSIDGRLKSQIGRAAFYFINPAGIVFGRHAQIDVPGAFYASTSGELKFADGSRFSAINPQGNTLSMAAPEAFGFLGKQTGTMTLKGAELVFKPGAAVHLSAGKITMANASLKGEGMNFQLASVGNAKQDVGITALPNHALAGAVSIKNAVLDASGNGKGLITIRAGDVKIVDSQISANNTGNLDMPANQGIDMRVSELRVDNSEITSNSKDNGIAGSIKIDVQKTMSLVNGGLIISNAYGKGSAGNISVNAENILFQGNKPKFSGIASQASEASGNAANIHIIANRVFRIVDYAFVFSSAQGLGNAGNVYVEAQKIRVDGGNKSKNASIASDTNGEFSKSAGLVKIVAKEELAIVQGGSIFSSTYGKGNAGKVDVISPKILIDGQGTNLSTGIFSSAQPKSRGHAGTVSVNAVKSLTLRDTGQISSGTFGRGNAGSVEINAKNVLIDGVNNDVNATGIFSDSDDYYTFETGDAGTVNVSVQKQLQIKDGGLISSQTIGNGNAGKVVVNAEAIHIENRKDSKFLTGIISNSELKAKGNPGQVSVTASKLISMKTGDISISSNKLSENLIKANSRLTVTTPLLILNNNSRISAESVGNLPASPIQINTSQLSMDNSAITTAANQSDGGPITINAKDWLKLKDSLITTSVANSQDAFGTVIGNGGDININTDVLVMDTGFIQANTNVLNASGGDINLNVKQLVASNGNLQSGGNTPLTFIPNSGINVIQAAAPDGINGNINNTAPQLNIVGALAGLITPKLDMNRIGHDPCSSTVQQNTIKKLGKGGIPFFNKGQDSYTPDRWLTQKPNQLSQRAYLDLANANANDHDCQANTNSHEQKI